MSDLHPAEEQIEACGEQPEGSRQGFEPEWTEFVDGLIGWATARADAALDEICAYLADRPPIRGWQADYPGESMPYRGRGLDQACSALRRRLRTQRSGAPRPMGPARPPRLRRSS